MRTPRILLLSALTVCGARAGLGDPAPAIAAPRSECGIMTGQVFVGRYLCGQGWTDMTLTITDVEGVRVRARGDFLHGPTQTSGAYAVRGFCFGRTQRMVLMPEAWVRQPPGYIMVGMSGQVLPNASGYVGRMSHRSCGEFSFARRR